MLSCSKKVYKYFAKHPTENALAHLFIGAGFGFLLTYPLAQQHPMRYALVCLLAGLFIHFKAAR